MTSYQDATQSFQTIADFFRFGLTQAQKHVLYYGHGTDNARDDMRALILGSLFLPDDLEPEFWHAALTAEEKEHLCQQLEKRIRQHVPVPYLTRQAWFCEMPYYVDERVLIPRSPLGELIQQQFSPWIEEMAVSRILDLCTGSGCIAIACCHAFPDALVDAVDLSTDALAVAEMNRVQHAVESQLTLIQSDCFANIPEGVCYDVIVSNPPYVGHEEMQTLPEEYRHEPNMALEAPDNGLAIVEVILRQAAQYLTPHGVLVVEVGNSEDALIERHPDLPLVWLEFEHGGQGVFLITRDALVHYFNP